MIYVVAYQCRMFHPTAKYSILHLDHSKPSEWKTLQATADCFGIGINSDIAVVFFNSCWPISADYSRQFEEVLLGSHEFLQVLSSRLEFETL
jgi:hypothetical protein